MHRELIFMYCEKIFMSRRKLCIARRYSCLKESYASQEDIHIPQKIMHRELIFMRRGRSCIASQYSHPSRNKALREDIHAPQEIMHQHRLCISREVVTHRHQLHSVILIKVSIKKSIKDDTKRNIGTTSAFIYFDKGTLNIILQTQDISVICFTSNPTELMSKEEGEQLNVKAVQTTSKKDVA